LVFAADVVHDEEAVAPSVEAGLDDRGFERDHLPAVFIGWGGVAEAPERTAEAEGDRGDVLAVALPALFAGARPAEAARAGLLGVAIAFPFDPFLGDGRDRRPAEDGRRLQVQVQRRADDALAAELRR
jgi:hypothetical protein